MINQKGKIEAFLGVYLPFRGMELAKKIKNKERNIYQHVLGASELIFYDRN
jgi:hypothetical protein